MLLLETVENIRNRSELKPLSFRQSESSFRFSIKYSYKV